jgi:hypothetical protein
MNWQEQTAAAAALQESVHSLEWRLAVLKHPDRTRGRGEHIRERELFHC